MPPSEYCWNFHLFRASLSNLGYLWAHRHFENNKNIIKRPSKREGSFRNLQESTKNQWERPICEGRGSHATRLQQVQGKIFQNVNPTEQVSEWRCTKGQREVLPLQIFFATIRDENQIKKPQFSVLAKGWDLDGLMDQATQLSMWQLC
ncbi:hypothetical protein SUGI_0406480 [Cryptomeria japonica]|nr:hypothetical protein SUGI_0406480 [Cryptomeria japonica]